MGEDQQFHEKEEKQFDEKEVLKHDEKMKQQDRLSTLTWALILIWAGFVFLSINLGWFDALLESDFFSRVLPDQMVMFEPGVWSIVMVGAGVIILLEAVLRAVLPQFHRNIGGTLLIAAVFIGVGLGNIFGWDLVWPVVLIAVGVSVLAGGLVRSRK